MGEDIKVGDRVRVDGAIRVAFDEVVGPQQEWWAYNEQITKIRVGDRVKGRASGRVGTVRVVNRGDGTADVQWDNGLLNRDVSMRVLDPDQAADLDNEDDNDGASAPLAILAKAAEECLQYHVPVEAPDEDDVGDRVDALSVGDLRLLVRQGKREGVI